MGLVRRLLRRVRPDARGAAFRDGEEVEKALRAGGYLNRVLERAWPAVCPRSSSGRSTRRPPSSRRRLTGCSRPTSSGCCVGARAGWSDGDVPLLDEAHALVGEPAAHVRPRDRRRGAGPDADAAPDGRATRPGRRADGPRRRRAGHRRRRLRELGGGPARTSRAATRPRSRSCATPTACRARSWSSRCRCSTRIAPRRRAAARVPGRRRRPGRSCAACRPRSSSGRPTARPRGSRASDGLVALIVPDELAEPALAEDECLRGDRRC